MKVNKLAIYVVVLGIAGCVVNKPHLEPGVSFSSSGNNVIDIVDSYRKEQQAGLISPSLLFNKRKKINNIPVYDGTWCTLQKDALFTVQSAVAKHCKAEGGLIEGNWCKNYTTKAGEPIFYTVFSDSNTTQISKTSSVQECSNTGVVKAYVATSQGVSDKNDWLLWANRQMTGEYKSKQAQKEITRNKELEREANENKRRQNAQIVLYSPRGTAICNQFGSRGWIEEHNAGRTKILFSDGRVVWDNPANWYTCR